MSHLVTDLSARPPRVETHGSQGKARGGLFTVHGQRTGRLRPSPWLPGFTTRGSRAHLVATLAL
ncbi:MAG: hypothetical protein Q8S73_45260, partial [Deltaproteobacteria bacterium]|nr:hypothetical protein [Deltaproteobacteria bacterium]